MREAGVCEREGGSGGGGVVVQAAEADQGSGGGAVPSRGSGPGPLRLLRKAGDRDLAVSWWRLVTSAQTVGQRPST